MNVPRGAEPARGAAAPQLCAGGSGPVPAIDVVMAAELGSVAPAVTR